MSDGLQAIHRFIYSIENKLITRAVYQLFMQKNPYWIMIGAVAGFFLGVLAIMLATADFSLYHALSQPADSAMLPPMSLRITIVILGMAAGSLAGLIATLILSKVSPEAELPVL